MKAVTIVFNAQEEMIKNIKLAITEQLAPKMIVDLIFNYAHGKCAVFALALATRLRVEHVVAVSEENDPNMHYYHYAVPYKRKLLDSYGYTSVSEINKRYLRNGSGLLIPLYVLQQRLKHSNLKDEDFQEAQAAVELLTRYHKW